MEKAVSGAPAPNRVRPGLTTFVVEDHAFQRKGLMAMLRSLGVTQIEEAANGRQALAVLERIEPPDVLLCDLEMPEMDGIEFLSLVAERQLARSAIIISGREPEIMASVEAMANVSGLHVLGQLRKPPTLDALRALLEQEPPEASVPRVAAGAAPDLGEARLRRALAEGEFRPYFQPKVSIATGELLGVEALARWRVADQAPVGPDVFIPALLRTGLITPFTEQIVDASCAALADWEREGLKTDLAINLTMSTLTAPQALEHLVACVEKYGIAPERVTFEVTETEVMANVARVLNVLTRLRLRGFGLAIDDFGTGYSSLSQLNAIPFTELKIDRSFVRHCERSPRLRQIVASSIELARRLQIRTVAEGVETERELSFLRQTHCDEAQGYLVAKPMPPAELQAWLSRYRNSGPV